MRHASTDLVDLAELASLRDEVAAWRESAAAKNAYVHSRARPGSHEEIVQAQRMESAVRACQPYVSAAIEADHPRH